MRTILHSDLNNCFASIECLHRPELRKRPVAVGGSEELRHGIVLSKNEPAKKYGVKTGEALWQARQKCPGLVVVPPDYPLYLRFCQMARHIYSDYTDRVEPFGLDEAWLDVSAGCAAGGDGTRMADEIRRRMREELGITVSVGVSYNKIFAKLGSDLKKPDATTVITTENYRELVWPLPASELLYVGRATDKKLSRYGIGTIGAIAASQPEFLRSALGKMGELLHSFANGEDGSPVSRMGEEALIKSIGNSTTTPRDLKDAGEVKAVFYVLAESVAERLREHGLLGKTLQIHVRDCELNSFERQGALPRATALSGELCKKAMELFTKSYSWSKPIRSLGLRAANLAASDACVQISMFESEERRLKRERLEDTVDGLRRRYGHSCIQRALMLADRPLGAVNPKEDHVVHPVGYFGGAV